MGWISKGVVGLVCLSFVDVLQAQTVVSGTYLQNFDSLASSGNTNAWTQDSSVPEWWAYRFPSAPNTWMDVTNYIANAGGTATGTLYSFGAISSSDRALGSIGSGNDASGDYRYGTGFTNGFASSITSVLISFRAETWRVGSAGNNNNVDFQYSVNASGVNDNAASWVDFDGLDFGQAANTINGPLDGNANFLSISSSITNLSISHGETVWIRWTDIDHAGVDHALAIDDLSASFTTVPEPATFAVIGIGWLAMKRRRRG